MKLRQIESRLTALFAVLVPVLVTVSACDSSFSTTTDDGLTDVQVTDIQTSDAPGDTGCTPQCSGKTCGDDGCGGTCGECAGVCTDGVCCVPACSGKTCGDDGCGGTCGECMLGSCIDGNCCSPDCTDNICGDDGCGGVCGLDEYQIVKAVASWHPLYEEDDISYPKGEFTFQTYNAEEFPVSSLRYEIKQYHPFNGPQGPGTFSLEVEENSLSYVRCVNCVTFYENCTDDGCEKTYLAVNGEVEIEEFNNASGAFKAVLRNVELKEARVNTELETLWTTGGDIKCIEEISLQSDSVRLAVPEPECVTEGTGTMIDTNIADFTLTNCLGEQVSLHSKCGNTKAMWMVLVAAWCPYCQQFAPEAYKTYVDEKPNLDLWIVLGEDKQGKPADAADCLAFAESHSVDPALTFYDPGYATVFTYIEPYSFMGIPYSIVLDGSNMGYKWSSGVYGDVNGALEKLLY